MTLDGAPSDPSSCVSSDEPDISQIKVRSCLFMCAYTHHAVLPLSQKPSENGVAPEAATKSAMSETAHSAFGCERDAGAAPPSIPNPTAPPPSAPPANRNEGKDPSTSSKPGLPAGTNASYGGSSIESPSLTGVTLDGAPSDPSSCISSDEPDISQTKVRFYFLLLLCVIFFLVGCAMTRVPVLCPDSDRNEGCCRRTERR